MKSKEIRLAADVKGRTMSSPIHTTSPNATPRPAANLIIAYLPPEDQQRLLPKLQPVELPQAHVLYEAQMPIEHVYLAKHRITELIKEEVRRLEKELT